MTDGRRRAFLIGGALAAVAIIVAGVLVLWPEDKKPANASPNIPKMDSGPGPAQVVDSFLTAVTAGNAAEAAALTDNPQAAQAAIDTLVKGVPAGSLKFTRKSTTTQPQPNATTFKVTASAVLKLSSDNPWSSTIDLALVSGKWQVKWAPTVIHPKLAAEQSIAVLTQTGPSGQPAVLGDDDKPIVVWEGSSAKPVDPKISPLLVKSLVGGGSAPGAKDSRWVAIVDKAGNEVGGEPLFGEKATASSTEPVKSTLNAKIAIAAQNAVAKASQPTMLVAIKPSTGGILAVAQNDAAGSALTALNGQYAPGSSFKIATAAAAIQQKGMSADSDVECPLKASPGGRPLKNADFEIPGTTKLHTAFARSCNTTFGAIAADLPADGLKKAATQFGLNADFDVPGIQTELGKVEDAGSSVQRVEDSIGQGKIQASPLGMAIVAATVAAKRAVTPQLRRDSETKVNAGYQAPPAAVLGQIQTMMGEVVSGGTATALKGIPGVVGKTGTAETENSGDNAHGWFVGFRKDVAFAVLVKDGKSSKVALDVTAAFLRGF